MFAQLVDPRRVRHVPLESSKHCVVGQHEYHHGSVSSSSGLHRADILGLVIMENEVCSVKSPRFNSSLHSDKSDERTSEDDTSLKYTPPILPAAMTYPTAILNANGNKGDDGILFTRPQAFSKASSNELGSSDAQLLA